MATVRTHEGTDLLQLPASVAPVPIDGYRPEPKHRFPVGRVNVDVRWPMLTGMKVEPVRSNRCPADELLTRRAVDAPAEAGLVDPAELGDGVGHRLAAA